MSAEIRMSRGPELPWSAHRSGMGIQSGVSGELSGSSEVFMTRQRIPPGMQSTPHTHLNCEIAMFVLQGPLIMRYGERLEQEHLAQTGDFFFVPPNALHQIANPRDEGDAEVVLCRNAAEEIVQEVGIAAP